MPARRTAQAVDRPRGRYFWTSTIPGGHEISVEHKNRECFTLATLFAAGLRRPYWSMAVQDASHVQLVRLVPVRILERNFEWTASFLNPA